MFRDQPDALKNINLNIISNIILNNRIVFEFFLRLLIYKLKYYPKINPP